MTKVLARTGAALVLVAAAVAALGARPADAAAGDPQLVNGQAIAGAVTAQPAVASDGTNALVVWRKAAGENGRGDVFGRFTKANTATAQPEFRISLTGQEEAYPDVAWNGSSYLVVWEAVDGGGNRVIRGRRVSKEGVLLGTQLAISPLSGQHTDPTVTAGPNGQFFVAWEDQRNGATTLVDVYGRRVGAAGALMDGTGIRLSIDSNDGFRSTDRDPDVAWNGTIYMVVWESYEPGRDVSGIDAGGATSTGQSQYVGHLGGGLQGSTRNYDATQPAVAAAGRWFTVVYAQEMPTTSGVDLLALRTDGTGGSQESFPVSEAAGTQDQPAIAFNGQLLVVWTDRRNGGEELWASHMATDGTVLNPGGVPLASANDYDLRPALTKATSASQSFTLAWEAIRPGGPGIHANGVQPAPK
jgi:hypothetical protein